MRHRTIRDLMTEDVASVRRNAAFKDIVAVLAVRAVSAVPVTDEHGAVIGVVPEADLLSKESEPDHRFAMSRRSRRGHAKAAATRAFELMTAPAITINVAGDVSQAARLLTRHYLKRLPVVDDEGRLVGIISRRDLLAVFLRSDREIAAEAREHLLTDIAWVEPGAVSVDVIDGVATVRGKLEHRSMQRAALELARRVEGVVDVIDHLTFALDDTHVVEPRPAYVAVQRNPQDAAALRQAERGAPPA